MRKLCQYLFGAYIVLILAVSVVPSSSGITAGNWDKLAHFVEYVFFAALWVLAFTERYPLTQKQRRICWVAAAVYGLFIELVQAFLPWRSAELGDFFMDVLGAMLGVLLTERCIMTFSPRRRTVDGA